jgi:hypothetical protein
MTKKKYLHRYANKSESTLYTYIHTRSVYIFNNVLCSRVYRVLQCFTFIQNPGAPSPPLLRCVIVYTYDMRCLFPLYIQGVDKIIWKPCNIVTYFLYNISNITEAIGGCFGRRMGRNSVGNYSDPLRIYSAKDWICLSLTVAQRTHINNSICKYK